MIFLVGVIIGLFVVPDGWTLPVIIGAGVIEIAETYVTLKISRRGAPKVGPELIVGSTGRVIDACRPIGRVRIRGETWRARCEEGADPDDLVRVVAREALTLVVEPAEG